MSRKAIKRGKDVLCTSEVQGFTKGKKYRVLGFAPKHKLILKDDAGKRQFPHVKHFKAITLIMKIRHFIYGSY